MNKFILLLPFLLLLGCISTGTVLTVKNNDTVLIDYTGSFQNGKVFDTSVKADAEKAGLPLRQAYAPLEFTIGAGQVIKGFNDGIIGMKVGEEKTITVPPADGYGEKNPALVQDIPRENIEGNITVGTMLSSPTGSTGRVVEVTNSSVKVDFNHELAGKTLVFKIKLVEITPG